MQQFLRILNYVRAYSNLAFLNILFNILSIVFSLISLTMIIPFLRLLFGKEKLVTENPTFKFSVNGISVQSSSSNTYTSGSIADNDIISAIAMDFGCPSLVSSVSFTVNPFATVNAGTDATICAGSTVSLNGNIGGSAASGSWSTNGNGSFDNASSLTAIYTPSAADTATGNISLILTTNDPDGSGPCPAVNDTVILTINPEATVNAGTDATICADTTQMLSGSFGLGL